ncbi:Peptidase M15 [Tumidithrix helvetica PCC 7403]|uniref:M15 family metallopeptidase n=1 Tax=Tumidithrix helvetica TaxID=3457545 RepID=UPI003C917E68
MPIPNDIPVAQRVSDPQKEGQSAQHKTGSTNPVMRSLRAVPWWGYGLAVIAFLTPLITTRLLFVLSELRQPQVSQTSQPQVSASPLPDLTANKPQPTVTTPPEPIADSQPSNGASVMFGHFAYEEAPANTLRPISRAGDGYEIKLRDAAAKSYLSMVEAARAEGIDLVAISGFRSKEDQRQLFYDISRERNQTPAQRAQVSAPPGYSEHHTGYAVDVGDGANPSTNLSPSFDKTVAFQWLEKNAARFSFELSFPPNNPQGVMYEPWHWRFVGDDQSLATFYKRRNSTTSGNPSSFTAPSAR